MAATDVSAFVATLLIVVLVVGAALDVWLYRRRNADDPTRDWFV